MKSNNPESEQVFEKLTAKAMRILLEKEGLTSTEQSQETNTVDSEDNEGGGGAKAS
ncbi:MAG: hypothetical protein ABEI32_08740 [Halothece sp.]